MNIEKIWKTILEIIEKNTTEISFSTWIKPLFIYKIDENIKIVYLSTKEDYVIKIIKNRYIHLIEQSFKEILQDDYRVVIKLEDEYKKTEKPDNKKPVNKPKNPFTKDKLFNPRLNFDNFVVGNSNKYAHAASLAVSESPSETYNPLFIYGGSGLGKTHLMHAIGTFLIENNPDINVLYVSSEMFTNEFIKALSEKKMEDFKNKYRKVDVLLIDDIQFLEGKETMQEEFFHTFNTLYEANKQIVITSDRSPNNLVNLSERLRSRFSWNLIADLKPADYETRVAILRRKAEVSGLEYTEDVNNVCCFIAEKITNNIRELEGAFNRVVSFAALLDEELNVNFAKGLLKDIFNNSNLTVRPEKIKKEVAKYYKLKVYDLESKKRSVNISYPRQVAMYLCRILTDLSLPNIGKLFGGKHYSTVIYSCDKIQRELLTNPELKTDIEDLKKVINDN
ncbi:MAG: chromosomal replication initiator protein DnaA [Clostridiales bacterium]|nr:chromosomal replication initiator protein DnaA [Clostridiales bacterium]